MAHFKKRQASLSNELGWSKGRANLFWHSTQPYRRDVVNQVAAWLGIAPHELLMPPVEALAIRRLRETAAQIVAESPQVFAHTSDDAEPGAARGRRRGAAVR